MKVGNGCRHGLFTTEILEISLDRESNPTEAAGQSRHLISGVWLVDWLVGWLVDIPQGLKVIGSSVPSAAHLAQGMCQLLHLLRLHLKRWSSSRGVALEMLNLKRCCSSCSRSESTAGGQAAIWSNSRIEALAQASSRQSQASA